jgi:hypothetical protein
MADPPEARVPAPAGHDAEPHRRFDRKLLLPALLIGAVILVPIAVWAASSGGNDDGLRVQQNVSYYTGGPEIVVAIPTKYNTMAETGNKKQVTLVCFDAGGKKIFQTPQLWPFINEPGYDRPHIHQPVSDSQLKALATCTVIGMKHKLTGHLRRT